jgi:NAD(P)-dependent dehydrogenase (short-subunit alcohol dehydrogenase family)
MPATMAPAPSTAAALAARASAVAGSRLIARPVASAAGANRAGRGAAPARAALSVSSSATSRRARRGARVVASAAEEDERAPAQADDDDEFTVAGTARRVREAKAKAAGKKPADAADAEGISGLNPVNIGRKSRQFVDGVFKSISGLTQFTRAPSMDEGKYELYDADLLSGETLNDYANPNARFTTVLVVGANGRVGRVLVRKLLLRGYTVKALVRNQADADAMPTAVQTHVGDVSDATVMERAVAGANKIVYCARAKTLVSGELANVDEQGVRTAVKSLQDYNNALAIRRAGRSSKTKTMLTNFVKHRDVFLDWTVDETRLVDPSDGRWQAAAEVAQRVNFGPGGEDEEGKQSKFPVFDGFVFSKTGVAQISAAIDDLGSGDARGEVALREHDGVLLRLKGDGKRYSVSLREPGVEGRTFIAPFATTGKWQIVRIPVFAVPPGGVQPRVQRGRRLDGHGRRAWRAHGFELAGARGFAVRSEEPINFPRLERVDGRDQLAVSELVWARAGVHQAVAQGGRDGFHPGLVRRRALGGGRGQGQARGEQAERGEDRAELRFRVHGGPAGHAA